MLRLFFDFLGLLFIGVGIILFPMPIPLGMVSIGIGVLLLAANEEIVQKEIRKKRQAHSQFDSLMRKLSKQFPRFLGDIVKKTDP